MAKNAPEEKEKVSCGSLQVFAKQTGKDTSNETSSSLGIIRVVNINPESGSVSMSASTSMSMVSPVKEAGMLLPLLNILSYP